MQSNKILGLDLGSKTLGIAISDVFAIFAQPVETYQFKTNHYKHAIEYVALLVEKENVTTIVLGLPINMNNTENERSEISRRFAKKLEDATRVNVVLWDERMTTMEVERVLIDGGVRREKRKDHVDKLAATVILQNYLDARKKERE